MVKIKKVECKETGLKLELSTMDATGRVSYVVLKTKEGKDIRLSVFDDGEIIVHQSNSVTIFKEHLKGIATAGEYIQNFMK